MPVITVQRTEKSQAVRYVANDETDHGIIRGWLGAPPLFPLKSIEEFVDGSWIIKDDEGAVYQVSAEAFASGFVEVLGG